MKKCDPVELTDIFDINKLRSDPIDIPSVDWVSTNASFAHAYHLKHFANLDEEMVLNCTIEHGFNTYLGGCAEEIMPSVRSIITYSMYRKRVLESMFSKRATSVGPYIAYVDGAYPRYLLEKVKSQNGKTIVVFPDHSNAAFSSIYDEQKLISFIRDRYTGFKTVVICLFYNDINKARVSMYREEGFLVTSAGNPLSIGFLRRLKTIIELSDEVLANSFTTGLVYSVFLKKKVRVFQQDITLTQERCIGYPPLEETEITKEFIKMSEENDISVNRQWMWGRKYAGFDDTLTEDELKKVLLSVKRG